MEQRNDHPLDVDLLAMVMGELATADIEDHVGECLLCRVRVARLRRSAQTTWDDSVETGLAADVPPAVVELMAAPPQRPTPETGQLWLAADTGDRLLVWIRAPRGDGVVVHPVTIDVDAADDSGLIVDVAGLDMTVAVVTSIVGTVATAALDRFVADLDIADDVETVRRAQTSKSDHDLRVGPPLSGSTDERLEARQLLADALAAFSEPDDGDDEQGDGDDAAPSPIRELYELIAQRLPAQRGRQCAVAPPTDDRLVAFGLHHSWDIVATVTELTCTVVVFTTDKPIDDVLTYASDALKLSELADATTVASVGRDHPHPTALFERPLLVDALETPRAGPNRVGPHPLFDPLPVIDALFKYLERRALISEDEDDATPVAAPVDRQEIIVRHAQSAIADLRAMGAQKERRLALRGLSDTDAQTVAETIREAVDADDLIRRLRGDLT